MSEIMIKAPRGGNKQKRRLGRGIGSGRGKTAGKGHKGQNARSGGGVRPGFEGGQMPLFRRVARRGFSNYPFKREYTIINLSDLSGFSSGDKVTRETLLKKGLIKKRDGQIKLLGKGEINKKLEIEVDKISSNAKDKISKAGGTVKELTEPKVVEEKKKIPKTKKPKKADKAEKTENTEKAEKD
jgi:large subunit ribosomal protein L15